MQYLPGHLRPEVEIMHHRKALALAAASTVLSLSLCTIPAAARISSGDRSYLVGLSAIDQTQVELTGDAIDRYIDATREMSRMGLSPSDASDPAKRSKLDAIAAKHGFLDYAEFDIVENNIGFVMAGIDPDAHRYIGRDAVIEKLVSDTEKDGSVPEAVKASRIAIIRSARDDTPDLKYPANIPLVLADYDRLIRAISGAD